MPAARLPMGKLWFNFGGSPHRDVCGAFDPTLPSLTDKHCTWMEVETDLGILPQASLPPSWNSGRQAIPVPLDQSLTSSQVPRPQDGLRFSWWVLRSCDKQQTLTKTWDTKLSCICLPYTPSACCYACTPGSENFYIFAFLFPNSSDSHLGGGSRQFGSTY